MTRSIAVLALLLLLSGCAASYTLVSPGRVNVGDDLSVEPTGAWTRVSANTMFETSTAEVWTRDGANLDSVVYVYRIADGQPVLKRAAQGVGVDEGAKKGTVPVFRRDMSPTEIMELFDATIARVLGTTITRPANLQPTTFAGQQGFRFDYDFTGNDKVERSGVVVGAVRDEQLFLIFHFGTSLYHFGRDRREVEAIFASARFT